MRRLILLLPVCVAAVGCRMPLCVDVARPRSFPGGYSATYAEAAVLSADSSGPTNEQIVDDTAHDIAEATKAAVAKVRLSVPKFRLKRKSNSDGSH
ncbi:MAG: hypothetical protein AAF532_03850 [Planctomycetota bacterium]